MSCRPEALQRECRPIRGIPVHTMVGDIPTGMFASAQDPTCSSPHHKAVAVKPVCQISSSMSENTSTHSGRSLLTSPQLASTFGLSLLCFSILFNTIVVTYSRPQATFLNITLMVTVIICVSEADPPSDDSVTTYGCYQIRSNNPAPHTHPMPHPLYIFRFSSI